MPLSIGTREVGHVTILDIKGRVVLGDEIGELRDAVRGLIAEGKKIILNLAAVDYIDSSGVGELVGSYTTVRNAGGELKLLNLTQKVHDILHVTKLYVVFDVRSDEFTAVKSFDYFLRSEFMGQGFNSARGTTQHRTRIYLDDQPFVPGMDVFPV